MSREKHLMAHPLRTFEPGALDAGEQLACAHGVAAIRQLGRGIQPQIVGGGRIASCGPREQALHLVHGCLGCRRNHDR